MRSLVLGTLAVCGGALAQARVIRVDADAPGPTHDGDTWATAYTDLQDGLSAATSGDEIWVAEGTYVPSELWYPGDVRNKAFVLVEGAGLYGGFAAIETSRHERDWALHETILSGDLNGDDNLAYPIDDPLRNNGENCYHVVVGASNATLDGFTVTAGNADDWESNQESGAGLYIEEAAGVRVGNCVFSNCRCGLVGAPAGGGVYANKVTDFTVTDCTFSKCSAGWAGGGMFLQWADPAAVIDCVFSDCAAGSGGGLFEQVSAVTVTRCSFAGNSSTGRGGGMTSVSPSTITACTFTGNSAATCGGGMHWYMASPTVTGCTFTANVAGESGGGIHCSDESLSVIADCTFRGNSADDVGGGIYNGWDSSPSVVNCAFLGNTAGGGGGMMNHYSSPAVANCVFSGNVAGSRGGGTYNNLTSSPSFTNCTFSGNRADSEGGGICNIDMSSTVTNCILWGDWAPDGSEICNDIAASCDVSHSDVGQVGGFTDGGGNVNADPLFVDADGPDGIAGTADDDVHLEAGSPCIDAADGDAAPGTDKDGLLRHDDPATPNTGSGAIRYADIGAYEFNGAATGTVTGKVILEDGADPALVTITAGGQTAIRSVSGSTIYYTINDVPGSAVGVYVETTQTTHETVGSPAPITWVRTDGMAADVTVRALRGTVTGSVALEDGADAAYVTITAAGRTATRDIVGDTIEYTITDVPVTTTHLAISTSDPRYEAIGSPASIAWVGTEGAAAPTTVRALRGTVTGTVALQDGADAGLVTISAGGQTGVKSMVGDTIEYIVSDVSLLTDAATIETGEAGYVVFGSPAPITWTGTDGAAADAGVCLAGTVTGTVTLEDGADAALVTITAEGQTATVSVVGETIEYTITGVPVLASEVVVTTSEPGYEAIGSPASVTWADTTGTATEVTVWKPPVPSTRSSGGCLPAGQTGVPDGSASGAIPFALLALLAAGARDARPGSGRARAARR